MTFFLINCFSIIDCITELINYHQLLTEYWQLTNRLMASGSCLLDRAHLLDVSIRGKGSWKGCRKGSLKGSPQCMQQPPYANKTRLLLANLAKPVWDFVGPADFVNDK